MYTNLTKIFYKSEKLWKETYLARFNDFNAKKLDFYVHEYGHKETFQLFYMYTEEIALLLNSIFKTHRELEGILSVVPKAAVIQFSQSCLINEIRSSNDIEGVKSSRREIRQAYDIEQPDRYVRLWGIVSKYKSILSNASIAMKSCQDIRQLYDDFILKEVVKTNPNNRPDGKLFRKDSVDVVTASQVVIHRGVEPEEKIIKALETALKILQDESIPDLLRIAIFHYLFGYIHPFYDGNGRISRFITSYLLSKEVNMTVALRLSMLIKKNRNSYYAIFKETNSFKNAGDLTPFIIQALKLILASEKSTLVALQKRLAKFGHYYPMLLEKTKGMDRLTQDIYTILLQATIYSDRGATIAEISVTLNKSGKTIRNRIAQMPKQNIKILSGYKPYHYKLNLLAAGC